MSTRAREEDTRCFGAAVAGNCESFSVVAGNQTQVFFKTMGVPND